MKLVIPTSLLKGKKFKCVALSEVQGYRDEQIVDHLDVHPDDLLTLRKLMGADPVGPKLKRLSNRLRTLERTKIDGEKFVDMDALAASCAEYLSKLPGCLCYSADDAVGTFMPFLMTVCKYVPPQRRGDEYVPGYISLSGQALDRGNHTTVSSTIRRHDLPSGGTDAPGLLRIAELVPETKELNKQHAETIESYEQVVKKVGEQWLGLGPSTNLGDSDNKDGHRSFWSRIKDFTLGRNGVPDKLVLDDEEGWGSDETVVLNPLRSDHVVRQAAEQEVDEEELDEATYEQLQKSDSKAMCAYPIHPYVRAFCLRTHNWVKVHVNHVKPYCWDRQLARKMIMPSKKRRIIETLLDLGNLSQGDDIISGKGKGVIVLLSGEPGLGKTLTAEVYSERARRPLYNVQCSQLGMTAEEVERNLANVFARSIRWNAIPLIDEADVYIRERGSDLEQNAIVGVFLRMLEYFTGTLFLATNRATIVDDAVLSRCIAHIRYVHPEPDEARQSWELYFGQYGIKPSRELDVDKLVKGFPKLSHRSIKQISRLAKTLANRDNKGVVGWSHIVLASEVQES